MTLRQRISRYLIGLGIGSLIVFFMFPQYDWLGWTPQKKLMEAIRESRFEFSARALCEMDCLGIDNSAIQDARINASADFKNSQVQSIPKVYLLHHGDLNLRVALADSTATLLSVDKNNTSCSCPE